ncbi:hypothetical protein HX823_28885 [Pseudomonas sp. P7759]|uniref:hypothetical protein n=1 Tax=Pseudomonas sp. P7759 TaxID=2738831 RepID=UPI0015A1E66E|nr:hypothetical protein [Pseudomonas sp. P7759]NWC78104.1 hypothetical protein [Pseudomonas sp. P7759]
MNDTPEIATDESQKAEMLTLPPKQSRDKEAESIRALPANASTSSISETNRVARILDRYPQARDPNVKRQNIHGNIFKSLYIDGELSLENHPKLRQLHFISSNGTVIFRQGSTDVQP